MRKFIRKALRFKAERMGVKPLSTSPESLTTIRFRDTARLVVGSIRPKVLISVRPGKNESRPLPNGRYRYGYYFRGEIETPVKYGAG